MTAAAPFRRPRAEACDRLTAASLRPSLAPEATACTLPGGQLAGLEWRPVRGCYGGRGRALLVRCPDCAAPSRVLWRPPGRGWGCWACRPVSHPSHRRPGTHRRRRPSGRSSRKPRAWGRQQLADQQARIARLLGLPFGMGRRGWRSCLPLVWGLRDLRAVPLSPDAPRLSHRRREALRERLDALESLRVLEVIAACPFRDRLSPPGDEQPRLLAAYCRATLYLTEWAMRRPGRDPRSVHRRMGQKVAARSHPASGHRQEWPSPMEPARASTPATRPITAAATINNLATR